MSDNGEAGVHGSDRTDGVSTSTSSSVTSSTEDIFSQDVTLLPTRGSPRATPVFESARTAAATTSESSTLVTESKPDGPSQSAGAQCEVGASRNSPPAPTGSSTSTTPASTSAVATPAPVATTSPTMALTATEVPFSPPSEPSHEAPVFPPTSTSPARDGDDRTGGRAPPLSNTSFSRSGRSLASFRRVALSNSSCITDSVSTSRLAASRSEGNGPDSETLLAEELDDEAYIQQYHINTIISSLAHDLLQVKPADPTLFTRNWLLQKLVEEEKLAEQFHQLHRVGSGAQGHPTRLQGSKSERHRHRPTTNRATSNRQPLHLQTQSSQHHNTHQRKTSHESGATSTTRFDSAGSEQSREETVSPSGSTTLHGEDRESNMLPRSLSLVAQEESTPGGPSAHESHSHTPRSRDRNKHAAATAARPALASSGPSQSDDEDDEDDDDDEWSKVRLLTRKTASAAAGKSGKRRLHGKKQRKTSGHVGETARSLSSASATSNSLCSVHEDPKQGGGRGRPPALTTTDVPATRVHTKSHDRHHGTTHNAHSHHHGSAAKVERAASTSPPSGQLDSVSDAEGSKHVCSDDQGGEEEEGEEGEEGEHAQPRVLNTTEIFAFQHAAAQSGGSVGAISPSPEPLMKTKPPQSPSSADVGEGDDPSSRPATSPREHTAAPAPTAEDDESDDDKYEGLDLGMVQFVPVIGLDPPPAAVASQGVGSTSGSGARGFPGTTMSETSSCKTGSTNTSGGRCSASLDPHSAHTNPPGAESEASQQSMFSPSTVSFGFPHGQSNASLAGATARELSNIPPAILASVAPTMASNVRLAHHQSALSSSVPTGPVPLARPSARALTESASSASLFTIHHTDPTPQPQLVSTTGDVSSSADNGDSALFGVVAASQNPLGPASAAGSGAASSPFRNSSFFNAPTGFGGVPGPQRVSLAGFTAASASSGGGSGGAGTTNSSGPASSSMPVLCPPGPLGVTPELSSSAPVLTEILPPVDVTVGTNSGSDGHNDKNNSSKSPRPSPSASVDSTVGAPLPLEMVSRAGSPSPPRAPTTTAVTGPADVSVRDPSPHMASFPELNVVGSASAVIPTVASRSHLTATDAAGTGLGHLPSGSHAARLASSAYGGSVLSETSNANVSAPRSRAAALVRQLPVAKCAAAVAFLESLLEQHTDDGVSLPETSSIAAVSDTTPTAVAVNADTASSTGTSLAATRGERDLHASVSAAELEKADLARAQSASVSVDALKASKSQSVRAIVDDVLSHSVMMRLPHSSPSTDRPIGASGSNSHVSPAFVTSPTVVEVPTVEDTTGVGHPRERLALTNNCAYEPITEDRLRQHSLTTSSDSATHARISAVTSGADNNNNNNNNNSGPSSQGNRKIIAEVLQRLQESDIQRAMEEQQEKEEDLDKSESNARPTERGMGAKMEAVAREHTKASPSSRQTSGHIDSDDGCAKSTKDAEGVLADQEPRLDATTRSTSFGDMELGEMTLRHAIIDLDILGALRSEDGIDTAGTSATDINVGPLMLKSALEQYKESENIGVAVAGDVRGDDKEDQPHDETAVHTMDAPLLDLTTESSNTASQDSSKWTVSRTTNGDAQSLPRGGPPSSLFSTGNSLPGQPDMLSTMDNASPLAPDPAPGFNAVPIANDDQPVGILKVTEKKEEGEGSREKREGAGEDAEQGDENAAQTSLLQLLTISPKSAPAEVADAVSIQSALSRTSFVSPEEFNFVKDALSHYDAFAILDEAQTTQLVNAMERRELAKGDVIVREGEPALDVLLLMVEGAITIGFRGVVRRTIRRGHFYGEVEVSYNLERSRTTLTVTSPKAVIFTLSKDLYREAITSARPSHRSVYLPVVNSSPMLQKLPHEVKQRLAGALQPCSLRAGAILQQAHTPVEWMYIILSGTVEGTAVVVPSSSSQASDDVPNDSKPSAAKHTRATGPSSPPHGPTRRTSPTRSSSPHQKANHSESKTNKKRPNVELTSGPTQTAATDAADSTAEPLLLSAVATAVGSPPSVLTPTTAKRRGRNRRGDTHEHHGTHSPASPRAAQKATEASPHPRASGEETDAAAAEGEAAAATPSVALVSDNIVTVTMTTGSLVGEVECIYKCRGILTVHAVTAVRTARIGRLHFEVITSRATLNSLKHYLAVSPHYQYFDRLAPEEVKADVRRLLLRSNMLARAAGAGGGGSQRRRTVTAVNKSPGDAGGHGSVIPTMSSHQRTQSALTGCEVDPSHSRHRRHERRRRLLHTVAADGGASGSLVNSTYSGVTGEATGFATTFDDTNTARQSFSFGGGGGGPGTSTTFKRSSRRQRHHTDAGSSRRSHRFMHQRVDAAGEVVFAGRRRMYRFPVLAFSASENIMISVVADGTVIRWNSVAESATGMPLFDVLGTSLFDLIISSTSRRTLQAALEQGKSYAGRISEYIAAGLHHPIVLSFRQRAGIYSIGLALSVVPSLSQDTSEVLLLVGREAKQRAASSYAADVAKWLEDSMRPQLQYFLRTVREVERRETPVTSEDMQHIRGHVEACLTLTEQFRQFSALNMDTVHDSWHAVRLPVLARRLLVDMTEMASRHNGSFLCNLDEIEPKTEVFLNVEQMRAIVRSLVKDAFDHPREITEKTATEPLAAVEGEAEEEAGSRSDAPSATHALPVHVEFSVRSVEPTAPNGASLNGLLATPSSVMTAPPAMAAGSTTPQPSRAFADSLGGDGGRGSGTVGAPQQTTPSCSSSVNVAASGSRGNIVDLSPSSLRRIRFEMRDNAGSIPFFQHGLDIDEAEAMAEGGLDPLSAASPTTPDLVNGSFGRRQQRRGAALAELQKTVSEMGGLLYGFTRPDVDENIIRIELPLLDVPGSVGEAGDHASPTGGDDATSGAWQNDGVGDAGRTYTVVVATNNQVQQNRLCQILWARQHAVVPVTSFKELLRKVSTEDKTDIPDIVMIDPLQLDFSPPDYDAMRGSDPIDEVRDATVHVVLVVIGNDFSDWRIQKLLDRNAVVELPLYSSGALVHIAMQEAERMVVEMRAEVERIEVLRQAFKNASEGRHRIVRLIGKGTFGEVFEVEDMLTSGRMAMKRLQLRSDASADEVVQEILAMTSLQHENIIHYFFCEKESNTTLRLFMELAAGGTLQNKIREHAGVGLPLNELVEHLTDICRGLAYIHSQSYVHCDLKTANLLLDSRGRTKIGDFGTAKRLQPGQLLYALAGTAQYMAPEVLQADETTGVGYDYKADIWSLGCIVLEMATGQPPFSHIECARGVGIMKYLVELTDTPDLSPLFSSNPLVYDFVKSCLEIDADSRPTAQDLLRHEILQGNVTSARAERIVKRAEMLYKLNKYAAVRDTAGAYPGGLDLESGSDYSSSYMTDSNATDDYNARVDGDESEYSSVNDEDAFFFSSSFSSEYDDDDYDYDDESSDEKNRDEEAADAAAAHEESDNRDSATSDHRPLQPPKNATVAPQQDGV